MQGALPSEVVPYPARLEGHLEQPSRALWLVKWLLLLPHFVVLAFLWLAFVVLSVVAFVVLLFGGGYPRGIFDYNVGVLRWTWRVSFYAFAANGTDRYPPFTLADVPDYPARVEVAYPQTQRRGLPLIGWWLAGLPHYVIVCAFAGSGSALGWQNRNDWSIGWPGLIGVLVFMSVVVLLFRGEYPRSIFDFVLGMNRWVLRVGAYAALMTPVYPPFRLDSGEDDPGGLTVPSTPRESSESGAERERGWGVGRIIAVVVSSLVLVVALGVFAAGTAALVFDKTQRDSAGYLMTGSKAYSTRTYALVANGDRAGGAQDWLAARALLGTVRVRTDSSTPVFVGIGRAVSVDRYLAGVQREVASGFDANRSDFRVEGGAAPGAPPTAQSFWAAKAVGSGVQLLTWKPASGNWRIVLMNADGSRGVRADLAIGARFPHLVWIAVGVLAGGTVLLLLGGVGLYLALRRQT